MASGEKISPSPPPGPRKGGGEKGKKGERVPQRKGGKTETLPFNWPAIEKKGKKGGGKEKKGREKSGGIAGGRPRRRGGGGVMRLIVSSRRGGGGKGKTLLDL